MRVLVACEFSGIVREAFTRVGHDAWSCDFRPTERNGNHIQLDVLKVLCDGWDLMIAHPPCTHLASSGARWWKGKPTYQQQDALQFVYSLMNCPIPKIAIENPVGRISHFFGKPSQIIQPWQFGHGETKATCLWLKGLPALQPTNIVSGRVARIQSMWSLPKDDRWRERSRTYLGIAKAMATQWGENTQYTNILNFVEARKLI